MWRVKVLFIIKEENVVGGDIVSFVIIVAVLDHACWRSWFM